MRRFLASLYRISSRAGFLAAALFLALIFWYLPHLLNLDAFRPHVKDVLESTFHCKVHVGGITGRLFPYPGLVIAPVVLVENSETPRLLASVGSVRMVLSGRALLKGKLEFKTLVFARPRILVHRVREASGLPRWILVSLPGTPASSGKVGIQEWQIRSGRIEIWDHTQTPSTRWEVDRLSGTFLPRLQTGTLGGTTSLIGKHTIVDATYNGAAAYPFQVSLKEIELNTLRFLLPLKCIPLDGKADLSLRMRFSPRLRLIVQLHQPRGAGEAELVAEPSARGTWGWTARGTNALLPGTDFAVPDWSAKNEAGEMAAFVHATSTSGARVDVLWKSLASLEVSVSTVTVRQLLQVFHLESKSPASTGGFRPFGFESWTITNGSMKALIRGTTAFDVQESAIDVAGMHLDLRGSFDLKAAGSHPQARVQGELSNIPMVGVVESFFPSPTPITGTGWANFNFTFPLSRGWVKELNGPVEVEVKDGILKALEGMYRVAAVLNLGNFLRLKFPDLTSDGIRFSDCSGHFVFQNGVLSTEDLFLHSPNMNIGVTGSLDIPGQTVSAKLRLEMLRFLEDILKFVPITNWIFKKPNKIFLPIAVSVEGPWRDPDIH